MARRPLLHRLFPFLPYVGFRLLSPLILILLMMLTVWAYFFKVHQPNLLNQFVQDSTIVALTSTVALESDLLRFFQEQEDFLRDEDSGLHDELSKRLRLIRNQENFIGEVQVFRRRPGAEAPGAPPFALVLSTLPQANHPLTAIDPADFPAPEATPSYGEVSLLTGKNRITVFSPVRSREQGLMGYLVVTLPLTEYQLILTRGIFLLGIGCLLFLILALALTYILFASVSRPIKALTAGLDAVARGNLGYPVDVTRKGLIGNLIFAFHMMKSGLRDIIERVKGTTSHLVLTSKEISEKTEAVQQAFQAQTQTSESTHATCQTLQQFSGDLTESSSELIVHTDKMSSALTEVGSCLTDFQTTSATLTDIVGNLTAMTDGILKVTQDLTTGSHQAATMARGAESLSRAANAAGLELDELLHRCESLTKDITSSIEEGKHAIGRATTEMDQSRRSVQESARAIERLGQRSERIGSVVHFIREIAEKTNVLALNASIIAHQAGEHGKSFGVVAGEIRELAERTQSATTEITDLVASVQKEIKDSVISIDLGLDQVAIGVQSATEAKRSIGRIETYTSQSGSLFSRIAGQIEQQFKAAGEVHGSVLKTVQSLTALIDLTRDQKQRAESLEALPMELRDRIEWIQHAVARIAANRDRLEASCAGFGDVLETLCNTAGRLEDGSRALGFDFGKVVEMCGRNLETMEGMNAMIKSLYNQAQTIMDDVRKYEM